MMSVACRSRFWACESVTVVWCKRVWVSWCGGGTVLLMIWAEKEVRSQGFVTGCSAAAARQSSWAAAGRHQHVITRPCI